MAIRSVLLPGLCAVFVTALITMIYVNRHCQQQQHYCHSIYSPRPWVNATTSDQLLKDLQDWEDAQRCACVKGPPGKVTGPVARDLSAETLELRNYVHKRWIKRQQLQKPKPPLAICPAGSPLQFVSSGLEVEPMQSIPLIGLFSSFDIYPCHDKTMTFTSLGKSGKLSILMKSEIGVPMQGNNTCQMGLSVDGLNDVQLNALLKEVVYESTAHVIDEWETVRVEFCGSVLNIHIHIRRQQLPFLYKVSSPSAPMHERVTILIKTFERYDKVNKLIDSIAEFYPEMAIMVADDSINYQILSRKNVKQYKMPPKTGWFAGRNLLLSQVATEYFVWTDDDFVFKSNTKLELFMERLDKLELNLDLVSGLISGIPGCKFCLQVDSDKEGQCISVIHECSRGKLDGYPDCVLVDRPTNFFMARTRAAQAIGFDPNYELRREAHNEFFLDGYHALSCACCSDVSVGHERGGSDLYWKNRNMPSQATKDRRQFFAFKYNAKCFTYSY